MAHREKEALGAASGISRGPPASRVPALQFNAREM